MCAAEYAEKRQEIEDTVRRVVDEWPPHVQATAYLYLHATGWRIDRARNVKRDAMGGE